MDKELLQSPLFRVYGMSPSTAEALQLAQYRVQNRVAIYSTRVGRILTEEQCDKIDEMASTTALSIDAVLYYLSLVYRMDTEIMEATYSGLVLAMQYLQQQQPAIEPKWWHGLEHIIQRHRRRRARARTQEAHGGRDQAASDTWWTYTRSQTRHRRFTRAR